MANKLRKKALIDKTQSRNMTNPTKPSKDNLTIKQVKEIQFLVEQHSIKGWKIAMRNKARELGLTDKQILEVNRGELGIKAI